MNFYFQFVGFNLSIIYTYLYLINVFLGFERDNFRAKVDWYWRHDELKHYKLNIQHPKEIFLSCANISDDIDLTTVLGVCDVSNLISAYIQHVNIHSAKIYAESSRKKTDMAR